MLEARLAPVAAVATLVLLGCRARLPLVTPTLDAPGGPPAPPAAEAEGEAPSSLLATRWNEGRERVAGPGELGRPFAFPLSVDRLQDVARDTSYRPPRGGFFGRLVRMVPVCVPGEHARR